MCGLNARVYDHPGVRAAESNQYRVTNQIEKLYFWLTWWIAEKRLRAFGRVRLQNFEQSLDTGRRVEEFVMTDMPDLPERTDDKTAEDAGHDLTREMSHLHRG